MVGRIKPIDLPFKINCETCCKTLKIDVIAAAEEFGFSGYCIVRTISRTTDWVVILNTFQADNIVPQIIIDKTGGAIDSIDLMTGYCGRSFDYCGMHLIEINKA